MLNKAPSSGIALCFCSEMRPGRHRHSVVAVATSTTAELCCSQTGGCAALKHHAGFGSCKLQATVQALSGRKLGTMLQEREAKQEGPVWTAKLLPSETVKAHKELSEHTGTDS